MLVAREMKLLINAAISEGLPSRYNPLLSRTLGIDKQTIGNRCHVHFRRFRGDAGQSVFDHETCIWRDTAPFHGTQIDIGMRFAAFDFVTGDADFEDSRELMSI